MPATIEGLRGEPPVVRSTVGVFDHAESRRVIDAHGRPVVAIGGISSKIAVPHAVLGARRSGHAVHVLVDAYGGFSGRSKAAFRQTEADLDPCGVAGTGLPGCKFLIGTPPRANAAI